MTGVTVAGPLWLSLKIAAAATALAGIVGIALAYAVSRRRFRGKGFVEAVITLPLVLPPTVVGYLLIVGLGGKARSSASCFIIRSFSASKGAILAAAVVALPMVYIPSRAAFSDVDREMEDVARLLGASRLERFWHVSLPLARGGIVSGLILGFAARTR